MSVPGAPHDCGGDVAAYALGALEDHELAAFEAHLEDCAACRQELLELTAVVEALPAAVPQYAAPDWLRRRVMRELRARRATRQGAPARRRLPTTQRGIAGLATFAVACCAAAIAVAVSGGGSVRTIDAKVIGWQGSAQLRVSSDRAQLVVRHMPAPGAGHVYEVWLQRAGARPAPTSALFGVGAGGEATVTVAVPGGVGAVSEVLVTREPADGTAVPTSSPVIVARLSG